MTKEFVVPVEWIMCGTVKVMADSVEEAYNAVQKNPDDFNLPDDSEYVDGTFRATEDDPELSMTKFLNERRN